MGDKSPKSKQKTAAQKTAVKAQGAANAKSKQQSGAAAPAKGKK